MRLEHAVNNAKESLGNKKKSNPSMVYWVKENGQWFWGSRRWAEECIEGYRLLSCEEMIEQGTKMLEERKK